MILYINTNSKEDIKFFLSDNKGNIINSVISKIDKKDSQKILFFLNNFLLLNNKKIEDLKYLVIVNGPGINTNFRIGIIITNTIAYVLKIPIVSILSTDFIDDADFIKKGFKKIIEKKYNPIIYPEYSIKQS